MPAKEQTRRESGMRATNLWRPGSSLLCVAVFIPPAIAAGWIRRYGMNIPYADDWAILRPVLESYTGSLSFNSLWMQHNEHRLLVGNIITLLLARMTRYNLTADLYCGLAFELLALLLIWRTLAITLRNDSILVRPLALCASLLMFSAVLWENWTQAVACLQFFCGVFWATATVWALAEWPGRWRGVLVASAAAFLGICTSALGFPLLILILLGILAFGRERRKVLWAQIGFLASWSSTFLAFYFKGYSSMAHSIGSLFGRGGLHAIAYFLAYLGSPFGGKFIGLELMEVIGLAGLAWLSFCVFLILRRFSELRASALPWMLIGVFAISNAALTAFGRLNFPLPQATSSRYRAIATLLWLAVLVLSASLVRRVLQHSQLRLAVKPALVVALILPVMVYVVSYQGGLAHMSAHSAMMRQALPSLLNYRTAPDEELRYLYPDPSFVRTQSELLEVYRLGPFADYQGNPTN